MCAVPSSFSLLHHPLDLLSVGQTGPRVPVAQSRSPDATFSARPANGNQFRTLPENDELFTGAIYSSVFLVGDTHLKERPAITLKALSDFDGRSPLYPILETAFSLNDPKEVDFDFVLDRGVELTLRTSKMADGSSTFRVR